MDDINVYSFYGNVYVMYVLYFIYLTMLQAERYTFIFSL